MLNNIISFFILTTFVFAEDKEKTTITNEDAESIKTTIIDILNKKIKSRDAKKYKGPANLEIKIEKRNLEINIKIEMDKIKDLKNEIVEALNKLFQSKKLMKKDECIKTKAKDEESKSDKEVTETKIKVDGLNIQADFKYEHKEEIPELPKK